VRGFSRGKFRVAEVPKGRLNNPLMRSTTQPVPTRTNGKICYIYQEPNRSAPGPK